MKQITNKEYEEWQKYKAEKAKGHVLLPDTIRFIALRFWGRFGSASIWKPDRSNRLPAEEKTTAVRGPATMTG